MDNVTNPSQPMDNKLTLARAWFSTKAQLDKLKAEEAVLRAETIAAYFGETGTKGTQKHPVSEKMQLSMSQTAKISVDKEAFEKHKVHMENKGLIGDEAVIRMKPEVSMTAYKYLSPQDKLTFADVFIHGLNSPVLSLESIKDK